MRNRHRRYRDTDDSPFDERGLLKDGRIYRARMTMMDARSVPDRPRVTNLDLRPGVGCHRPGYRILTDAADRQSAAKAKAYADYENSLCDAWRGDGDDPLVGFGSHGSQTEVGPSTPPFGAYPYTASAEGAVCTVNGAPGHLRRKGDWLVCVADRPNVDEHAESKRASDGRKVRLYGRRGEYLGYREAQDDDDDESRERATSDARRRKPVPPEDDYDSEDDELDGDDYESDEREIVRNVSTHTESTQRSDARTVRQMKRDKWTLYIHSATAS